MNHITKISIEQIEENNGSVKISISAKGNDHFCFIELFDIKPKNNKPLKAF